MQLLNGKLLMLCVLMLPLLLSQANCLSQEIDPTTNEEARSIYSSVMSPFCPGRLLADCPSPDAEELRAEIYRDLSSGLSKEDIKQGLYAKYGDGIRTVPLTVGFGLLGWLVPFFFMLGGIIFTLVWFKRQATCKNTDTILEDRD